MYLILINWSGILRGNAIIIDICALLRSYNNNFQLL